MQRMKTANQDYRAPGRWSMEGYLYVQEKREFILPEPGVCVGLGAQSWYVSAKK